MQKLTHISYGAINEELYYGKLKSGLQVYIIPKAGYNEKSAMLTVNFGSLDSQYTSRGRLISNPEGVAHFLEHKLFEDKSGGDVSLKFTSLGAEVNAFTTFDKTSYFFSTTDHFLESLNLLQDFVMTASFTEESVNKEKKIIGQEIDMYLDDPEYQSYIGALQNLFPGSNLAADIAGSRKSIDMITGDVLRRNYKQFYHPSNMALLIVGEVDVEETFQSVLQCQENHKSRRPARAKIEPLPYLPLIKSGSIAMDISTSKLVVAYRGVKFDNDFSFLEYKICLKFLLSMLFGWTSKTYQDWYGDGKVDESFDIEIEIQKDYSFVLISLDSSQPIAMSSQIRKKIEQFTKAKDINNEHLTLLKKEMYGDFLQSLDSVEQVCNQFNHFLSDGENYFDIPEIIAKVTLEEILAVGENFFGRAEVSDFTVFPK
ncbi:EF-P 5-aminopentanol modification-associated protein YfmH [Streptococcus catagoni]|uniref:EF-P 5-aminopentanol modification-associated protein YfmH n=1 Tax=Streptococcus catagoni TaxID=2654874 RepID=UPI001408A90C|nr:pitrilysin family protein [Streptococcus catagoni]